MYHRQPRCCCALLRMLLLQQPGVDEAVRTVLRGGLDEAAVAAIRRKVTARLAKKYGPHLAAEFDAVIFE